MDPTHEGEPALLNEGAEYGNLAFDRFVVANWDTAQPEERDQERWNDLAGKWLSMGHVGRSPYWKDGDPTWSPPPDAPYLPTQAQIQRILAPHQTITERNACQHYVSHTRRPVWIRTCYAADLEDAYQAILESAHGDFGLNYLLSDARLYSHFEQDWTKVFLRVPLLLEHLLFYNNKDPEDDGMELSIPRPDDEAKLPLYDAIRRCRSFHYLLDEEALREQVVKVQYLDIHGQPVWYNKVSPDQIQTFEAHPSGGALSARLEFCEEDRDLLRPGTLLDLDF